MPTKAQLTQTLDGYITLVRKQIETIAELKQEIEYRTQECSDLFDCLDKYRKENPIIIAEYRPAIRRLRKENEKLKEKNKKLKEYILAVDSCILFAPRGQVRQRYEELDKSWFNEEEDKE